jgi:hypothetical protein
MTSEGIEALDASELIDQRSAIATGFRPATLAQPPRHVKYDIREFVY